MRVLISDPIADVGVQKLMSYEALHVDVKTDLSPSDLKDIIEKYEALIIRSKTEVDKTLIKKAKNLKVVARAGIGLDNVDIVSATKRGIVVMNTPTGNIVTTAEHAIAMMMALARNIPMATESLKEGKWEKKKFEGQEIYNKTLGIIGFGKIGSIVADRATGLKMRVLIYDPFISKDQIEKKGYKYADLDTLFQHADYITIHAPKLKETKYLIDETAFHKMKNGVRVINCARGGIIKERALIRAIRSGKVKGAALDVFETEPPGKSELFNLDGVIATPHLGASTFEAQAQVALEAAEQVADFLLNGTITNAVNVPSITGDALAAITPYLTLGDRLGSLQSQLVNGAFNEVVVEYSGDFSSIDLSVVTTAVLKGMLEPLVDSPVNFINASFMMKERGIKVVETTCSASEDFTHLMTVRTKIKDIESVVSGTLFGNYQARIVKINNFRLELIPEGNILLIYCQNKPGAIGAIGRILGKHHINIGRMQVGQEHDGSRNIIFLNTDTPITPKVVEEIINSPKNESITTLFLGGRTEKRLPE